MEFRRRLFDFFLRFFLLFFFELSLFNFFLRLFLLFFFELSLFNFLLDFKFLRLYFKRCLLNFKCFEVIYPLPPIAGAGGGGGVSMNRFGELAQALKIKGFI